jgi:hypothetical protein
MAHQVLEVDQKNHVISHHDHVEFARPSDARSKFEIRKGVPGVPKQVSMNVYYCWRPWRGKADETPAYCELKPASQAHGNAIDPILRSTTLPSQRLSEPFAVWTACEPGHR